LIKLYYYHARQGNFGDDLNAWLWGRFFGAAATENAADTLLVGIGTILDHRIPKTKKIVIFSSGAGYHALPENLRDPSWDIVSVRGPLTAAALALPADKAVTDGAILIAALPEFAPVPANQRHGVVFMPHIGAAKTGEWQAVCQAAGVEFIDPRADSRQTIERIRHARLVLADAMHAAIVADTVRVPWVPLVTSDEINSFKWRDWTQSMRLPYRPVILPHSGISDILRSTLLPLFALNFDILANSSDEAALSSFHQTCRKNIVKHWRQKIGWKFLSLLHRLLSMIKKSPRLAAWLERRNEPCIHRTATAMKAAAESPAYLSDDAVYQDRLAEMHRRLKIIADRYI
jgi:succinoglycan biosynthesis protein ExoV